MVKPIHTLGDARDVGLELIAVCRHVPCRHRVAVNLDALIYAIGEGQPILPERDKVHFSERMRCSECKNRGAYLWPLEMKGAEPLLQGLSYSVNEWYGGAILQAVAKVSHVIVAHSTFDAAVVEYPGRRLTLQQGAFVLRDSRISVIQGGKR